jgi:hypothetical protein
MIDHADTEVITQLGRWADQLAAQVPAATPHVALGASTALHSPRRARWVAAIGAAAAVAAAGFLVLAHPGRRIEPAPPADTATTVDDATPSTAPVDGALPLAGTQWSARHESSRLILELQQVHNGRGIVVGLIGRDDGVEGGCTAVDGTVQIEGETVRFSDLSADLACTGAAYFLAALRNVATHFEHAAGELVLRNDGGTALLTLNGCTGRSCTLPPLISDSDRTAPPAPLEGVWRFDFTDSGVSSAVFDHYLNVDASLTLDGSRAEFWAGVAGGCFSATAPYAVDGASITFGAFEVAGGQCGVEMSRVIDRLQGRQQFRIDGRVLNMAGLDFLYERPPDTDTTSTVAVNGRDTDPRPSRSPDRRQIAF